MDSQHLQFTLFTRLSGFTWHVHYMAARAGVEPMTLRTKGVDSTNAPHWCPSSAAASAASSSAASSASSSFHSSYLYSSSSSPPCGMRIVQTPDVAILLILLFLKPVLSSPNIRPCSSIFSLPRVLNSTLYTAPLLLAYISISQLVLPNRNDGSVK